MHGLDHKDGDRVVDWSQTSEDYATHRPGYPASFYQRLKRYNIGISGQRILDLATGTGTLARTFAQAGAEVVGQDISEGQIESAKRLALKENLTIDFRVGPAEETGLPDNSFDLITASQCWLYFDKSRMIPEVKRLLKPGGRLVTSHLCWLSRVNEIARESEALVKKHNPDWSADDWSGEIPFIPEWASGEFEQEAMFYYDEDLSFTHDNWRGRIRACRGVAATLNPDEVQAFDTAHMKLLKEKNRPKNFNILHRIDAHILKPRY